MSDRPREGIANRGFRTHRKQRMAELMKLKGGF